ncbi:MAG: hypothetical protein HZA31_05750 [Opitutae bacterium]|nr:hypothetical protein [Opitutae bacterium]
MTDDTTPSTSRWQLRVTVFVALCIIAGVVLGLVRIFRLDIQLKSHLTNVSCRARVGGVSGVVIIGFTLTDHPQTIVVRTLGPSLTQYGVPDALPDTTLRIIRQEDGREIVRNDDWQTPENERLRTNLTDYAPKHPREAACVLDLKPGAYTAIVEGKNGAQGVVLIDVFNVK